MGETMTDPEQIEMFRILTLRRVLKLEVETGVQIKGYTLRKAKETLEGYGIEARRTRKDVLAQYNELLAPYDEAVAQAEKEAYPNVEVLHEREVK